MEGFSEIYLTAAWIERTIAKKVQPQQVIIPHTVLILRIFPYSTRNKEIVNKERRERKGIVMQ